MCLKEAISTKAYNVKVYEAQAYHLVLCILLKDPCYIPKLEMES